MLLSISNLFLVCSSLFYNYKFIAFFDLPSNMFKRISVEKNSTAISMPTKYARKKFLNVMHLMLQIIEQFIVLRKCRNLLFLKCS